MNESNLEPWQMLDEVIRKWAALSGHEKDQEWYKELKEHYQ